jgi:hypothetical protein
MGGISTLAIDTRASVLAKWSARGRNLGQLSEREKPATPGLRTQWPRSDSGADSGTTSFSMGPSLLISPADVLDVRAAWGLTARTPRRPGRMSTRSEPM